MGQHVGAVVVGVLGEELRFGVREVEARGHGQAEVGEVQPLAVGDDVGEVRVEVLDTLCRQEAGDVPQVFFERQVVAHPPGEVVW
ncbi:hypothetical protein [Amycolatopsis plumensis]|uniref:Uncharacterized protein n=1 Tax=Amycolatopsis plumensis TaxID=236508 RepID=A0ABV5UC71_9PSEU